MSANFHLLTLQLFSFSICSCNNALTFFWSRKLLALFQEALEQLQGHLQAHFKAKDSKTNSSQKRCKKNPLKKKNNVFNELWAMIGRIQFEQRFCRFEFSLELANVEGNWIRSRPCSRKRLLLNH